ncbi:hypothetical protein QA600_21345 [Natronococcus sp. A-GB1]|uniref:hypothetical protein n=1 Tax=Natronococcus sp. A-GB1 TaxID=3037648 RepID=UPI00241CD064|nr:hypothetical protein [Natronococcus sp. A-GB1]MDG5761871.1 hypothetical protein [Natronococcus sp. A-GB1]
MSWHRVALPILEGTSLEGLDRKRFAGVVAVVLGACQVALTFTLNGSQLLIVGSGGWLLVAIGLNLVRGRTALESDWNEGGEPGWIAVVLLMGLSIWVVVATADVLVFG